jgi:DNA-binding GntR family transcriptional regulator
MKLNRSSAAAPDAHRDPPPQVSWSPAFDARRQPLYLSLAQALKRDIDEGRYPVGSLLPTEEAIATRYAVSRHTVRQALRELKEDGVISAHPGIGTRVRARTEATRFFSGINTVGDLLQFVESTEMQVLRRKEVIADDAFAAQFQCKPGQAWLEMSLLRKVGNSKRPLGYVQAYVRPEYAPALGRDKSYSRPIYSVIEERCGVRVVEILQEITAANLDAAMARALKTKEGEAAMRITRYFLDRAGAVVEISVGHYPSGLYTQRSRFRASRGEREDAAEAAPPAAPATGRKRHA